MKYKITHTTTYLYSEPVPVCHNQVHLIPREGEHAVCRSHRLNIKPAPATSTRRKDYFGNHVHAFSIEQSHRKMTVTATSRVEVSPSERPDPAQSPPWESVRDASPDQAGSDWLDVCQFRFDSPAIKASPELAEYAFVSFHPGRPIIEAVLDLVSRIHADFQYDTSTTTVSTTTDEAFRLRMGVCQDLAQVGIGCLRSIGLPARYVSGYLRTIPPPGEPRLVGADQSHAWLAAYCGEAGWIDIDPTNNIVCSTDHITLAWGRDYTDVCPIKGVFIGGGTHQLAVSVEVQPLS